jgi:hypothetical protein
MILLSTFLGNDVCDFRQITPTERAMLLRVLHDHYYERRPETHHERLAFLRKVDLVLLGYREGMKHI